MKFLHVADAHLDSPFGGLSFLPQAAHQEIQESTKSAFTKMVDVAITRDVDFVLLVGDTFDSNNPVPATQLFLMREIERLTKARIHTFISFGNHDYMTPENLLVQSGKFVHIFDENVATSTITAKDGTVVDVIGFSYVRNHITEDVVQYFPAKVPGHYTIGMLHGSAAGDQSGVDNYAPFSLTELNNKNYDYFALGHIHLRQLLSSNPLIIYPGNLQGRHVNEPGTKGFYELTVDENGHTTSKFVATSIFIWQTITLDLPDNLTKELLFATIIAQVDDVLKDEPTRSLITLTIRNSEVLEKELHDLLLDPAILNYLSQKISSASYLVRVHFAVKRHLQLNNLDQQYLEEARQRTFTPEEVQELAKPLLKHGFIADFLADPTTIKRLVEQAELLLQQEMGETRDAD